VAGEVPDAISLPALPPLTPFEKDQSACAGSIALVSEITIPKAPVTFHLLPLGTLNGTETADPLTERSISFVRPLALELSTLKSPEYHKHGLQNEGGPGFLDLSAVCCAAATVHIAIASSMHHMNRLGLLIGASRWRHRAGPPFFADKYTPE
jgi:hypothetical protein